MLALALEHYEATRVNELGLVRRIAEDRAHAKDFRIDDKTVDYSLKALDEYQKRQKGPGKPGVRPRVEFVPTIRPEQR